jgi:hypothetical protein
MVYFKTPQAKANAMKAGTHEDPKAKKGGQPKADAKPNNMFGTDYKKDRGAETPKDDSNWMDDLDSIDVSDVKGKADPNADSFTSGDLYGATFKDPQTGKTITVGDAYEREDDSPAYQKAFAYVSKFDPDKEAVMGTQAYADLNKKAGKSKYDDASYWELNKDDYQGNRPDWAEDNPEFTAASLDLIDKAISDEFGKDFSFDRQFGGGEGGFEGPMQIFAKGNDGYSISVGSNGQDGKFSIGFLEPGGEEMLFEPNWDPINGENELSAQQAYKVTKALMKMPEVQKLLKGEMKPKQFGPTYAKIKDKFSKGKTESTKLTSMIKR